MLAVLGKKNTAPFVKSLRFQSERDSLGGVAKHFASLKAWARINGRPASDFDLLVAATALAHDLTLATLNARHFHGMRNLTVEDWTRL